MLRRKLLRFFVVEYITKYITLSIKLFSDSDSISVCGFINQENSPSSLPMSDFKRCHCYPKMLLQWSPTLCLFPVLWSPKSHVTEASACIVLLSCQTLHKLLDIKQKQMPFSFHNTFASVPFKFCREVFLLVRNFLHFVH